MTQVGERLIVEVACYPPSLSLSFVGKIQTRVGEFVVRLNQRCTGARNSAPLKHSPKQC